MVTCDCTVARYCPEGGRGSSPRGQEVVNADPICGRVVSAEWGGGSRGQRSERVQDWDLSTSSLSPTRLVEEMEGLVGGQVEGPGDENGYQLGSPR